MPDGKVLGTMRCPVGATVRHDPASMSHVVEADGWIGPEDEAVIRAQARQAVERRLRRAYKRTDFNILSEEIAGRKAALAAGRVRCPESGPVSEKTDDDTLIVVLCPEHGAVDARADIWKGEVR